MFRTVSLSIIRSLALYTQQEVYVVQVFNILIPLAGSQQTYMPIAVCTG